MTGGDDHGGDAVWPALRCELGESLIWDERASVFWWVDIHQGALYRASPRERVRDRWLFGETLGHVHYAIDYLKSPEAYRLGPRVVVVGAGNVALDAASMAARNWLTRGIFKPCGLPVGMSQNGGANSSFFSRATEQ